MLAARPRVPDKPRAGEGRKFWMAYPIHGEALQAWMQRVSADASVQNAGQGESRRENWSVT